MLTYTALVVLLASTTLSLTSANAVWPKCKLITTNKKRDFPSLLFKHISKPNENNNLIVSPYSIQSALTLVYMGAEGPTAQEFQNVLHYNSSNKTEIAQNFSRIENSVLTSNSDLTQLQNANRIYTRFDLVPKFNEIARKYFKAEAEMVDFKLKEETASKINAWVEDNTNKKITNLINPASIDDYTTAILVNAIYFKAQWAEQFSKRFTQKQPFFVSEKKSLDVDTMSGEINCKYVTLTNFDATAIELQYTDTDIVMDVILPNKIQGLKELERKISLSDLRKVFENVNEEDVNVKLPKFKIEFETGLIPVLTEMGMKTSFEYGANFKGLFNTNVPVKISDVIHKAFIEVNEYGSEAAASTYTKVVFLSYSEPRWTFKADHPFMFVIRNPNAVLFVGHVKNFDN